MAQSNYDLMRDKAKELFLEYDQEKMIRKFCLRHDSSYLYLSFAGRPYRVCRSTGRTEWSGDGFVTAHEGNYNEAMTIYDVLCYSKEHCRPSGVFCKIENAKGLSSVVKPGDNRFHQPYAEYFGGNPQGLAEACKALGGAPYGRGDVAYRLPLFSFIDPQATANASLPSPSAQELMVALELWEADEDFPASLALFWDENILDYMHFETTFFAAGHLLERLKEIAPPLP